MVRPLSCNKVDTTSIIRGHFHFFNIGKSNGICHNWFDGSSTKVGSWEEILLECTLVASIQFCSKKLAKLAKPINLMETLSSMSLRSICMYPNTHKLLSSEKWKVKKSRKRRRRQLISDSHAWLFTALFGHSKEIKL